MLYIIPTDTCFGIACPISETDDYKKIYKIKKREYNKPLAVMVEDFIWLEKNTNLTKEQIDFLKKYDKPFTVLTNSSYLEMYLNLEDEKGNPYFENAGEYEKIAFRVANNETQKKLVHEVGPIFLTSANFSGMREIYDTTEAKKQFEKYLKEIKFIPDNCKLNITPTSDIFEFIEDSLELNYLRKN